MLEIQRKHANGIHGRCDKNTMFKLTDRAQNRDEVKLNIRNAREI